MESKSNPSRGSSFVGNSRGPSSAASRATSSCSIVHADSYMITKDQTDSFDSPNSLPPSSDEYATEQDEDCDLSPKQACAKRWSRVTALFLGLAVLASIGLGLFFWMDKEDVDIKKAESAAIAEEDLNEISLVELEQHNEPQDCWLAIHGFVWDLTEYAPEHPGGPEYVTDFCGQESTRDYEIEHPVVFLDLIPETKVGIFPAPLPVPERESPSPSPSIELVNVYTMSPVTTAPVNAPTSPPTTGAPTPEPSLSPSTAAPSKAPATNAPVAVVASAAPVISQTNVTITSAPISAPQVAATSAPVTAHPVTHAPTQRPTLRATPQPTFPPTLLPTPRPTPRPTPQPVLPPTAPPTDPPEEEACFTLADVQQHATQADCWYMLYGSVWDLTEYVDNHPGGARRIFDYCGGGAITQQEYESESKHDEDLLWRKVPQHYLGPACGQG